MKTFIYPEVKDELGKNGDDWKRATKPRASARRRGFFRRDNNRRPL